MTTIVHYGAGNLRSVIHAFERLDEPVEVASDPERVRRARRLVLPGVGSFDAAMAHLDRTGILPVLNEQVMERKVPILGICLGMQMFTKRSEEGSLPGLGWIAGETVRFRFENGGGLKVPHIGWNEIERRRACPTLENFESGASFYFAHSYHVVCGDEEATAATSNYGGEFVAAVQKENLFGVQFHPEKSHILGERFLRNFLEATRSC